MSRQPRDLAVEGGAQSEIERGGGDHHRGEESHEAVGFGAEQAQVERDREEEDEEAEPGARGVGGDVARDGGHDDFRPTTTRPSVIACAGSSIRSSHASKPAARRRSVMSGP